MFREKGTRKTFWLNAQNVLYLEEIKEELKLRTINATLNHLISTWANLQEPRLLAIKRIRGDMEKFGVRREDL